jgi:hypothetical protein
VRDGDRFQPNLQAERVQLRGQITDAGIGLQRPAKTRPDCVVQEPVAIVGAGISALSVFAS